MVWYLIQFSRSLPPKPANEEKRARNQGERNLKRKPRVFGRVHSQMRHRQGKGAGLAVRVCGYTDRVFLPARFGSVFVSNFKQISNIVTEHINNF